MNWIRCRKRIFSSLDFSRPSTTRRRSSIDTNDTARISSICDWNWQQQYCLNNELCKPILKLYANRWWIELSNDESKAIFCFFFLFYWILYILKTGLLDLVVVVVIVLLLVVASIPSNSNTSSNNSDRAKPNSSNHNCNQTNQKVQNEKRKTFMLF